MSSFERHIRCPLCLCERSCLIRLDRRQRPYFKCRYCASTIFCGHPDALTGPALLDTNLPGILSSIRATVEDVRADASGWLRASPAPGTADIADAAPGAVPRKLA